MRHYVGIALSTLQIRTSLLKLTRDYLTDGKGTLKDSETGPYLTKPKQQNSRGKKKILGVN